jgi:hypothetical protein
MQLRCSKSGQELRIYDSLIGMSDLTFLQLYNFCELTEDAKSAKLCKFQTALQTVSRPIHVATYSMHTFHGPIKEFWVSETDTQEGATIFS